MSSSSKFVIGSDEEQLDQDLDYKHAYDNSADQNQSNNTAPDTTKKPVKPSNIPSTYQNESVNNTINHLLVENDLEYKSLSEIIDTSEYYQFQKLSHKIIHPLVNICDYKLIRKHSWLQIPFIKYMICITSMIIGITLSQLIIKGYELKAAANNMTQYDLNDVIYFLMAYVTLISILCICFLYLYYQFKMDNNSICFPVYDYNYYVMTCSGIIGYGILYLLIHIQNEFHSNTLEDSFEYLITVCIFAISFIGVIIFIKQFIFDFNFKYTPIIENEYDSDEDNETNPLLNDDDSNYYPLLNNEFIIDTHIDEDERILNEYKEKGIVWFTISLLTINIWHFSIGLIIIECVVYVFNGNYINLLINWTHDSSNIVTNIWNIIVFGFLLAFVTIIIQITLQIYCKSPLYNYQLNLTANTNEYTNYNSYYEQTNICSTLPHKKDIILFLLNWLNDINCLWNKILASAIGWSLLTPNQTNNTLKQFITAITATILFLFIGFIFSDYKRRIQKDIITEIRDIKKQLKSSYNNVDNDGELMKMIVYDKQKLIFYDKLQATYDLAFAVSVSYSWQSTMVIGLQNCIGNHPFNIFCAYLFLTVFITIVFGQLGIELVQLKNQRLKEAKLNKKRKHYNKRNNKVELQIAANKQIPKNNEKKTQKLSSP